MKPKIALVNPPIMDFSAYDFWLKPFGLISIGGYLRGQADLRLFDFLLRRHPGLPSDERLRRDQWGRGTFHAEDLPKPAPLAALRRRFHRFGLPRPLFQEFLRREGPFDAALVATGMTYWYPGVSEVIEDLRAACPRTHIVLGGIYATLCTDHARGLGADMVVAGRDLAPLWHELGLEPHQAEPPWWEGYDNGETGVLKLTDGCPFRCSYCSVPLVCPTFTTRPLDLSLKAFDLLCRQGVQDIAFYDDALLFRPQEVLIPFLRSVTERKAGVRFHTPNGLNARFLTEELAELLVRAGFTSFFLGFESGSPAWQRETGGKVDATDLQQAVVNLTRAGADPRTVTAYLIVGHPAWRSQDLEASMDTVHRLGIRIMLAEFSPIPGTPDAERCRDLVDMDEPLWHNKTAFAIELLGHAEVNRLKDRCRALNRVLAS